MSCHAAHRFKRCSGLLVQSKHCFPCLVTFLKNLGIRKKLTLPVTATSVGLFNKMDTGCKKSKFCKFNWYSRL